jgi:hypothetical protein
MSTPAVAPKAAGAACRSTTALLPSLATLPVTPMALQPPNLARDEDGQITCATQSSRRQRTHLLCFTARLAAARPRSGRTLRLRRHEKAPPARQKRSNENSRRFGERGLWMSQGIVANMASYAISSSLILVIHDNMIIGINLIVSACLCRHF